LILRRRDNRTTVCPIIELAASSSSRAYCQADTSSQKILISMNLRRFMDGAQKCSTACLYQAC
jgi:hypothetical protein